MTKIHIIGTKDTLEPTLRTLHRLGMLQIEDVAQRGAGLGLPRMTLDAAALAQREEIGKLVTRVEASLALLSDQSLPTQLDQSDDETTAKPTEELVPF